MNVYRIIFIFFIVLFIFENKIKKYKKEYKNLKKMTMIILILLVGFRGEIDRDSSMYVDFFLKCPTIIEMKLSFIQNSRFEYGYILLNSVVKIFTNNYNYIFLLIAIISFYNLYIFINYFSTSFFYPIALYYSRWMFLREFTQIRNGIGYSFFLISLIYLDKLKLKKSIFFILLGGAFHKSIYFCLSFIVFKYFLEKKNREYLIEILIFLFFFIDLKKIINIFFINILGLRENYVVKGYMIGKYSVSKTNIAVYYSVIFLLFLILFNKKIINSKQEKKKYKLMKCSYIYSVFISIFFFGYGDIRGRLASIFNTEFILQEKIYTLFKNKIIIKSLLICYLIFIYFIIFSQRLENEYLPYFK